MTLTRDDWHARAKAIASERHASAPRALRLEPRLQTGVVWINTLRVGDISVPVGGRKQSGLGRDKSIHCFDEVTAMKSVWVSLEQ